MFRDRLQNPAFAPATSRLAVAMLALAILVLASATAQAAPIGAYTTKGAYSFASARRLHPPILHTDARTKSGKLARGYFLVANFKNLGAPQPMVGQGGPLILDSHLQPVWFRSVGVHAVAADLKAQTLDGQPVLSWWQGVISKLGATVSGKWVVVDQHYKTIAKLSGDTADGWVLSLHEMLIQGHDAWVTAYKTVHTDLRPYGGSATGALLDSAVQEYDLTTGQLLYTWDAFNPGGQPNIRLSQSKARPSPASASCQPHCAPWDAYHVNSIQLESNGQFLVSMRNTWAAYLVDPSTNAIQWTLGGKASTFKFAKKARFQWQHDVELHQGGREATVFDDACCAVSATGFGPWSGPSRGVTLKINYKKHFVSLAKQYTRGKNFHIAFLGNTELLPNGNLTIGWGTSPFFSEYSRSGKLLFDGVFPSPNLSYRTFVQHWVGTPGYAPNIWASNASVGSATIVKVSWNGATNVSSWRVLAGSDSKHLKAKVTSRKRGFETTIVIPGNFGLVKAEALDSKGHVLRDTAARRPHAKH